MTPPVLIVLLVLVYLALGVLFALPFALFGVGRIDPVAAGASARVRLLVVPGAAALWPILLNRWVRAHGSGEPSPATDATDVGNDSEGGG